MGEPFRFFTPEEYLEFERAAERRHEYVGGYVYERADCIARHVLIAGNLTGLLWIHLKGGPCLVMNSQTRLHAAVDLFYYPDLMVQCAPIDLQADYIDQPRYVVEVASPSTRRIDRAEKAEAYWRVPSIEAYLIVAQDAPQVVVLRRGADDWETEILTRPEDILRLDGIGFRCTLADIYAETGVL